MTVIDQIQDELSLNPMCATPPPLKDTIECLRAMETSGGHYY